MSSIRTTYAARDGVADATLVLAMTGGTAVTAGMLADSWPAGSWYLDAGIAAIVTLCALARRHFPTAAAAAGLGIAATAIGIAFAAELPQEPGPATSLGLGVLLGSAVRRAPTMAALAVSAGGLLLLGGAYTSAAADGSGFTLVIVWLAALLSAGIVTGSTLRMLDAGATSATRGPERMLPLA